MFIIPLKIKPLWIVKGTKRQIYWQACKPDLCVCLCVYVCVLSCVQLFATSWTVACKSLSKGFLKKEYWSGFPFPSPEDLPKPRIESASPVSAGGFFTAEPPGKPKPDLSLTQIKIRNGLKDIYSRLFREPYFKQIYKTRNYQRLLQ